MVKIGIYIYIYLYLSIDRSIYLSIYLDPSKHNMEPAIRYPICSMVLEYLPFTSKIR